MKLKGQKAVVCGAGGFIGGHLVQNLLANGVEVIRAVDIKPLDEWYQTSSEVESLSLDLQDKDNCLKAAAGAEVEDAFDSDSTEGQVFGELGIADGEVRQVAAHPFGQDFHCLVFIS